MKEAQLDTTMEQPLDAMTSDTRTGEPLGATTSPTLPTRRQVRKKLRSSEVYRFNYVGGTLTNVQLEEFIRTYPDVVTGVQRKVQNEDWRDTSWWGKAKICAEKVKSFGSDTCAFLSDPLSFCTPSKVLGGSLLVYLVSSAARFEGWSKSIAALPSKGQEWMAKATVAAVVAGVGTVVGSFRKEKSTAATSSRIRKKTATGSNSTAHTTWTRETSSQGGRTTKSGKTPTDARKSTTDAGKTGTKGKTPATSGGFFSSLMGETSRSGRRNCKNASIPVL